VRWVALMTRMPSVRSDALGLRRDVVLIGTVSRWINAYGTWSSWDPTLLGLSIKDIPHDLPPWAKRWHQTIQRLDTAYGIQPNGVYPLGPMESGYMCPLYAELARLDVMRMSWPMTWLSRLDS